VGEILKAVDAAGIGENTLVVFTSDNGAAVGSSLPLRAKKGSVYDGGIREPTWMRWTSKIPAGSVCIEVAASIDILPTIARLTGSKLPERKIDGQDIWPLMSGQKDAHSPHKTYCLLHGPGTVRSGQWKFYPWKEGNGGRRDAKITNPSALPVQLYDTVADIGEKNNVAADHPEIVEELQAAYDKHLAELQANKRPTAPLIRPAGANPSARPGDAKKKPRQQKTGKKKN
jgi:arylsulfatase A